MRIPSLVVVMFVGTVSAAAASAQSSIGTVTTATPEPGTANQASGTTLQPPASSPQSQDPSLDRIRAALKRQATFDLLRNVDIPADFRLEILEQARLDELISKLDFSSGPAPAGGLYSYEQQLRAFNPVDRPLMQPYAAFSGGELITIALENIIGRWLGGKLINALGESRQSSEERSAKEEVQAAINEFCAKRPDRWSIELCNRQQ